MELSSHDQEAAEIPMPLNSAYVGVLHAHAHHAVQMTHHHHNHHDHPPPSSTFITPQDPSNNNSNGTSTLENQGYNGNLSPKMKMIRYRECQKNHAASMGGNATDGCGEFMPSGEEGSIEALTCSACNCHRNFHRRQVEGDQLLILPPPTSTTSHFYPSTPHSSLLNGRCRSVILGSAPGTVIPFTRSVPINMSYQVGGGQSCTSDHSDDDHYQHNYDGNGGGMLVMRPYNVNQGVKKRFRTKFSQEQKEKMLEFAEKVGWKIQKQEENVVQQFCQQIGVKRKVLKVWMHNNKHILANKNQINLDINNTNNINSSSTL